MVRPSLAVVQRPRRGQRWHHRAKLAAVGAAGLVADLDDLEHGYGVVEVDAAAAQPGQLAEPQPGAEQG
jgi:hypothetical protein